MVRFSGRKGLPWQTKPCIATIARCLIQWKKRLLGNNHRSKNIYKGVCVFRDLKRSMLMYWFVLYAWFAQWRLCEPHRRAIKWRKKQIRKRNSKPKHGLVSVETRAQVAGDPGTRCRAPYSVRCAVHLTIIGQFAHRINVPWPYRHVPSGEPRPIFLACARKSGDTGRNMCHKQPHG